MVDNITLSAGSADGAVIQTDDIGGVHTQIIKLAFGALNTATLVHSTEGLPVAQEGTWTVDLGATDNAVLDAIAASVAAIDIDATTIIGHVDGIEGILGTIDADTGAILTAAQLIDNAVYVDDADWTDDTSSHFLVGGVYQSAPHTVTDGDVTPFLTDVNGRLATVVSGTVAVSNAGLTELAAAIDTEVQVDIVGALPAGANTIGVVDLGATDNAVLDAIAASVANIDTDTTTIIGHLDGVEGLLTTIDADTGGILTATQLIDDAIYVDDADWTDSTSKHALVGGLYQSAPQTVTDGDVAPFNITANGAMHVAQQGTVVVDLGANNDVTVTGTVSIDDGGNIITVDGTVAVTNAGLTELAAAINASSQMDVNIAASGATVPVSNAGLTELASAIYAEDVGHTGADPGMFALGVRYDTPITALTNTDADYTAITTDKVGGVRTALYETDFAVLGTNHVKKYYTSTGAATDGIIWSPAAGKRWYVTDIFLQVSAACTVTLEDDKAGGDEAIWKAELPANGGWSHSFATPWFSGEDAADLLITTTAGNVYVTAVGYEV